MASSINASTSGAGGVITTADNTGILNLQTASTTAVTIDASQNVGIGTTSPIGKLDVVAAGSSIIRLYNATGTYASGWANSMTAGYSGTISNHPLVFATNDTERMRIDSSGNVLVGTTSQITTGGWTPLLSVLSSSNTAYFKTTGTGNSVVAFQVGANGQNGCVFINASGTTAGSITVNASTTAYNTSSDYRLKENIAPMIGALDKITQLKPVTYNWKSDGSDGQGFIAHELQEIVPDAVTGEKDAVDDDGNPKYQGVDTSFLVATLTAAIQEQQTIINDLKARVTALEAK